VGGGDDSIARARRPEALAASMSTRPKEGLDWLGRPPGPRAPRLYRLLVGLGEVFLYRVCDLQVRVEGREHLPTGGYIAICALHRSWIDPLLVIHALPLEPRVWFLGSGPTAFDRPWKERLLRRTGGMLPVWRGGHDVSVHVRAASSVVEQRAVLALFMEGAIAGPPDGLGRSRAGSALMCLRTGAPIVPIAICGAEELYRGKRISVRILEPTTADELLPPGWDRSPPHGSREELRAAHAITDAVASRIMVAVDELYPTTVDPPDETRRWSWLTRLMR
jgi:1-acyl-sn-glycerol-3-phosphate acyltransferase